MKHIPPLKPKKKMRKIAPDSLTMALHWDKIADQSFSDDEIPLAPGDGIAEKSVSPVKPDFGAETEGDSG